MAFDEELAGRVREIIGDQPGVTEKRCSADSPGW
jgi:hypothetical protein